MEFVQVRQCRVVPAFDEQVLALLRRYNKITNVNTMFVQLIRRFALTF